MKNTLYLFSVLTLSFLSFGSFAGNWENYSNITMITDAEPVGDHVWITCKGGVIDFNTVSGERTFFKRGDAGLPSSAIEQVAQHPTSGVIWVGTYDSGVMEWDGGSWITYPFPDALKLYRMKFDSFGGLWIQADMGLYKFDCVTHEYTFVNSVGGAGWVFDAWDFDITPEDHVLIFTGTSCLVIDAATTTPIDSFPSSESPVVLTCTPTTVRLYGVDEDTYLISNFGQIEFQFKDGTYTPAMEGLPEFAYINNIIRGSNNEIYAFVDGNAIYQLVDLVWEFVKAPEDYMYDKLLYTNGSDFFLDEYAYMSVPRLINAADAGTEILNVQEFDFNDNNIDGMTRNEAGEILMSSASQIFNYDAVENEWDLFVDVPTVYGSLYDLKYADGKLYGIDYGNLIEYYDGATWTHIPYADGFTSIYIFDYDVTADGEIYFTNDEGLFRYADGVTENLIETYAVETWFSGVAYDASRDVVWLGGMGGVIKYDFDTQELINSTDVPEMAAGSSIQCIELDAENNVWFGANNDKAYKFDGSEWTDFTLGNDGDFIIDFVFDGTKTYFGLTDGTEGVYRYDSADDSWMYFNMSEDMTMESNSVNQMALDLDGNLWIAHGDAGASVYRMESEPVGINDPVVEMALQMFPNPATDMIMIDRNFDGAVYSVADMLGNVVMTDNLSGIAFDISSLPAGEYLLTITEKNSGQKHNAKFVVQ